MPEIKVDESKKDVQKKHSKFYYAFALFSLALLLSVAGLIYTSGHELYFALTHKDQIHDDMTLEAIRESREAKFSKTQAELIREMKSRYLDSYEANGSQN